MTKQPEGFPAHDLPSEPAVFASDYAPEEISAIAEKLRVRAGLPKKPSGEVANGSPQPEAANRRAYVIGFCGWGTIRSGKPDCSNTICDWQSRG